MRFVTGQKGQTLIEVLIAVALLGMLATAFLGGLFAALKADIIADERAVCQSLSQSHLEFVKSQAWSTTAGWDYTVTSDGATSVTHPSWWDSGNDVPRISVSECGTGYSVEVSAVNVTGEPTLCKITVEVYRIGELKLTLEGYKAKI